MMSTMQKIVAAVLVCALAASTLPAASAQTPECLVSGNGIVRNCSTLFDLFTDNPTLNRHFPALDSASDAQIEAAITADPKNKPTPECCADLQYFVSHGCRCDKNNDVDPILTRVLHIEDRQLYTFYRTGVLACGLPKSTDPFDSACTALPPTNAPATAPASAPVPATAAGGK